MSNDLTMKALFAQVRLRILNMKREDMHRDDLQYFIENANCYAWVHSTCPIRHDGDDSLADRPSVCVKRRLMYC